jgi:hypothetical protein
LAVIERARGLEKDLAAADAELRNLAETAARGGAVPIILAALERREADRRRLRAELAACELPAALKPAGELREQHRGESTLRPAESTHPMPLTQHRKQRGDRMTYRSSCLLPCSMRRTIRDVWNARLGETKKLRSRLETVVRQKQHGLDRIEDAFLHERSIDRQAYEHQREP